MAQLNMWGDKVMLLLDGGTAERPTNKLTGTRAGEATGSGACGRRQEAGVTGNPFTPEASQWLWKAANAMLVAFGQHAA